MKVFLTSAYDRSSANYGPSWLRRHARSGLEYLVEQPEQADIILFVEQFQANDLFFRKVHENEYFKRWSQKCLLYHSSDEAVAFCRVITPSNSQRLWGRKNRRTFHYIARHCENETINAAVPGEWNPKFLYSFQGAGYTHVVRRQLMKGRHVDSFILDNGNLTHHTVPSNSRRAFETSFVDVLQASQFVLCPRGIGVCSYRLFETMQMGRVPVIISDDWIPVPDLPWEECSITIKESQIESIPDILQERRKDAQEMGVMARKIWEQYFSPQVSLTQLIRAAEELSHRSYGSRDALLEGRNLLFQPFIKIVCARLLRCLRRGRLPDARFLIDD